MPNLVHLTTLYSWFAYTVFGLSTLVDLPGFAELTTLVDLPTLVGLCVLVDLLTLVV